jgi:hypothetical protein
MAAAGPVGNVVVVANAAAAPGGAVVGAERPGCDDDEQAAIINRPALHTAADATRVLPWIAMILPGS